MTQPRGQLSGDISTAALPHLIRFLRPLVDAVARVNTSVHTKLFLGFFIGALLLVGMAGLSFVVLTRMRHQVDALTHLQDKMDRVRQMSYLVTAQSHYRAMALLTNDEAQHRAIANAKQEFAEHLTAVEQLTPELAPFLRRVRDISQRFDAASSQALALHNTGHNDEALHVHLTAEHPI